MNGPKANDAALSVSACRGDVNGGAVRPQLREVQTDGGRETEKGGSTLAAALVRSPYVIPLSSPSGFVFSSSDRVLRTGGYRVTTRPR